MRTTLISSAAIGLLLLNFPLNAQNPAPSGEIRSPRGGDSNIDQGATGGRNATGTTREPGTPVPEVNPNTNTNTNSTTGMGTGSTQASNDVSGTVQTITRDDQNGSRIRIRDENGRTRDVKLDNQTKIIRDNREVTVLDLKDGDSVTFRRNP